MMKAATSRVMLLILSATLLFNISIGQTVTSGHHKSAINNASRFIRDLQKRLGIPGISICVGNRKQVLWAAAFGMADLENNTPVTLRSKFRIGSVSKCLTSLAVGKLYGQGKLAMDTPIQTYVPHFPAKKYPLTIRQLAGHTAGIRHYRADDPQYPVRFKSVSEGLRIFQNDTLLFEPGTAYSYSTYAYTLISAAVEGVSNTPFTRYMEQEILSPLGMNNTIPDYPDSIVTNRVRFYDDYGSGLVNALLVDNSYKWAGGGYLSTPSDLVIMGRELLSPKLLSPEVIKMLTTPQRLKSGTQTIVGIAWRIEVDSKGRRIVHHGGTIEGGRTFVIIFPEQDLIIAVCANKNVGGGIDKKEMETIADIFLKPPSANQKQ
ncbi:MAG TPA: serine hydrolase domain-containing protein [Chitinophagaceae bacterium]|nr:serine hydrolase domain-containing protein [Chitinophagaceae bacterium]